MRTQWRRRRRRDERGAVVAFIAITLVLLVGSASLAIDLGMQRVMRSDLQALADAVALDSARLLDGRSAYDVVHGSDGKMALASVVTASADRNKASAVGSVTSVTGVPVYLTLGPNGERQPLRSADGTLTPVPDNVTPDAVLITAAGRVGFSFTSGSGGATRTALSTASSYGCFRLGSFAASLKTGDSALSGVFESLIGGALGINLRAVGYQGLLNSSIGIPALAAKLGVGTPQELVNLQNVKVADLLRASAQVLSSQGDTSGSAVLADIAAKVSQTTVLDIGKVLAVGGGSALAGNINALDLIGSAGIAARTMLANGNNFLDTGVVWAAPHVSGGDILLQAVAAPAQYCGPVGGGTSTAQVTFTSDFPFNLPNNVTVGSLGSLSVGPVDPTKPTMMHVDANLAGATGTLAGVTCGSGTVASPQVTKVNVDTSLLTTAVNLPFRVQGTLDVSTSTVVPSSLLTSLFGILQTGATVKVTLDLNGANTATVSTPPHTATTPTVYSVPPLTYGQAQPSGSGQPVSIPTPSVVLDTSGTVSIAVTTTVLGIGLTTTTKRAPASSLNLTALVSALTSTVIGSSTATVVSNVNNALVPVSQLLGIEVAGADVIGTFAPSCSTPALAG